MNRDEAAAHLGVDVRATSEEVKSAHRRWALHLRAGAGDAAASERFRLMTEARDVLLAPVPPPAPPVAPSPAWRPPPAIFALRLAGPTAWRGGPVNAPFGDGRMGFVEVPPAVEPGTLLPARVNGAAAWAFVEAIDCSPWRRGPDATPGRPDLGPLDLGGKLEVSLYDVVTGARVSVDGPWGPVAVRLPAGSLTPLRLRGQGLRPEGREPGALLLELSILMPPADDALVELALKPHRRAPRVV